MLPTFKVLVVGNNDAGKIMKSSQASLETISSVDDVGSNKNHDNETNQR